MNLDSTHGAQGRGPIDPEDPLARFQKLTQSARIHGQCVWLELLRDRVEWNATPEWAQDEAIKAVATQLGDSFQFQKTDIYECGGQRHRIAQFEHLPTGARLNLLPGGSFEMGSPLDREEGPVRRLSLPAFLLGVSALSQSQWDRIGGADQRRFRGERRPIESVSWQEAQDWLRRAGEGLSLPTEAEWEYGCRAGTRGEYCFGDDPAELRDYAWFNGSFGLETVDIGLLKPNAFGLRDVHGNVCEWCEDCWRDDSAAAPSDGAAVVSGELPTTRIFRGGSWNSVEWYCRAASRGGLSAEERSTNLGFRLCRRLD